MKVCALLAVGGVFAVALGWAVARLLERIVSALERSKRLPALAVALVLAPTLLMLAACAHTAGADHATHGVASWYDEDSHTATGARYNPEGMTAAHRTLPFGTFCRNRVRIAAARGVEGARMDGDDFCALRHHELQIQMQALMKQTVEETVKQTLQGLGIDVSNPTVAQAQFASMRALVGGAKWVGITAAGAFIIAVSGGIALAVWTGIKQLVKLS